MLIKKALNCYQLSKKVIYAVNGFKICIQRQYFAKNAIILNQTDYEELQFVIDSVRTKKLLC